MLFRSAVYTGDVSAHLAQLVIKELGIKARSEKPGLSGRASIAYQSTVDREEAILAGREAVKAALEEATGVMIGLERLPGPEYVVRPVRIPIEKVMLTERLLPDEFITPPGQRCHRSISALVPAPCGGGADAPSAGRPAGDLFCGKERAMILF